MNNFVQPGDVIEITAPTGGVTSGALILVGGIAVVPVKTAAAGERVNAQVTGVVDLSKTEAQAWAEGARVYWDETNTRADSDGTVGPLIGVATAVAANPSTIGRVRLNGVAPALGEGPQAAVADVAAADADGTYGTDEVALINELKTKLNTVLARLRDAGIIAT